MSAPIINQAIVLALLEYDPATGIFVWKKRSRPQWNARYAGKEAGYTWTTIYGRTYRSIRIFDWPFMAHRVAVLYMTGEWPAHEVDHKNGNSLDNRWSNLRLANKFENGANRGANKNNRIGLKGVSRQGHKFRATIQAGGQWKQIGVFNTPQEAHAAYKKAAKELHGEFARSS